MDGYTTKKLNVVYFYADEDRQTLEELDKQLNVLKSRGWIQSWHEGEILPGMERDREVESQLNVADIILLFVSADFLASDRCYRQMQLALSRRENRQATVIPLLIRPTDWQNAPLGKLRILPENGLPVTQWNNRDEALYTIANEIQMVVKTLLKGVYLASVPAESSFVLRLQRDLEDRGIIVWSAPKEQSSAREKTVRQMIRASHIVVLIASPSTKYARSIKEELRIADMYQKRIIPVWVAGHTWQESTPPQLVQSSYIDGRTSEDYGNALGRIITLYDRVVALHDRDKIDSGTLQLPSAPLLEPRNPYKALRAFTSSDEDIHDFFGREKLTSELVEAMREILTVKNKVQSERFLAVIGPSGVGKSSVVMAGLLPRLRQGVLAGSENWVYLTPMVPGARPVESLALVLANERLGGPVKAIYDDLVAEEARGLYWQAFQLMKSPGAKIVLVVDQFEELFTQPSEQERQHFIDLLVAAATDPQSPVVVIVTLRADFYDRPMNYPELRKLIGTHSRLVPAMDIDELRNVIEKPADHPDVQLSFDEDLVGDLLFEMRGQAGALPLLEFTLDQLVQRRRGQQLTRQAYEEIGGVKGALAKQAESTYAALPSEEHQQLVRALFLRLIDPGVTEQDTTRRRAALAELKLPDPKQTALLRSVADTFIAARLLTTNEIGGSATIEVSHEALIPEWPRLTDWLHEARDDILLQQSLSKDVMEWVQRKGKRKQSRDLSGQSHLILETSSASGTIASQLTKLFYRYVLYKPLEYLDAIALRDLLYRGDKLKEAKKWAGRNRPSEQEVAFLQASATRRTLTLVGLIVVFLLLLTSTGIAGGLIGKLPPDPTLVTTTQDSVNGSLRYCIDSAPSGSTIRFAQGVRGTIKLIGGLAFAGGKQLTIVGPGANQLTISGGYLDAHIHVSKDATLNISGLSFKNSETINDAFLFNEGTLTLTNSIISGNKTRAGGAIFINSVSNGGNSLGGGIENRGTLTVTNSTISNNASSGDPGDGLGGGIENDGQLTVTNSTISNNSVSSADGGNSFGGGIDNYGQLFVTDSTFSHNSVSSSSSEGWSAGGGIYNHSHGTLTVINSTISGNSTLSSSSSNNSWSGGGGIENDGKLTVVASTFLHNSASGSSSSQGGGIYYYGGNNASAAIIRFCTIYGNISSVGGGIWIDPTGSHPMTISSSIIAANRAPDGPDISGALISDGYNRIENVAGSKVRYATTDRQVTSAALKIDPTLRNNGGPTWTLALLPGSPAIDIVPRQACSITFTDASGHTVTMTTDQRGDPRPDGLEKMCDVGAYESS